MVKLNFKVILIPSKKFEEPMDRANTCFSGHRTIVTGGSFSVHSYFSKTGCACIEFSDFIDPYIVFAMVIDPTFLLESG